MDRQPILSFSEIPFPDFSRVSFVRAWVLGEVVFYQLDFLLFSFIYSIFYLCFLSFALRRFYILSSSSCNLIEFKLNSTQFSSFFANVITIYHAPKLAQH